MFTMHLAKVFAAFIAGTLGMWPALAVSTEEAVKASLFPMEDFEIMEIRKAFIERITRVREDASSGDFLDSHIDLSKARMPYQESRSVLVIDVGGTSLKISEVVIDLGSNEKGNSPSFHDIVECSPSFYRYPDISGVSGQDRISWNEWVADQVVEFYGRNPPRSKVNASLTFSYPLIQTSVNNAQIKKTTKNFCFREDEATFTTDIVEALNSSLRSRKINVCVNCVLNDSTATYMAGVLRGYKNIIGIVLGTGTNSSFCVKKGRSNEVVLYNSEWGSTRVPRSMLTEADLAVVVDLEMRKISHNIIDVLAGGCKLGDIVLHKLRNTYPEIYEEYAEREEVLHSMIHSAITGSGNGALAKSPKLRNALMPIVRDFRARGMKILASLIGAVVESTMDNANTITLVLNGTTFSNAGLRDALGMEVKRMHPDIEINLVFLSNASLEGSALVSLMYSEYPKVECDLVPLAAPVLSFADQTP
ncbi:hexokinase [Encephalitozoon cuniculi]|nr:hexokinase [Encephalitozoon cuniculi]